MAIELEGLEFKVEGLSGASTKGLEDLTNALSGLKSALPTKAKISGVATGISQLSNAFAQLSTHTKTMGRFAAAMGNLRQARVSPGLVKNLESLATSAAKFADLSDEAITKIERLSAALRGLRGVGRISLAVPRSAVAEQTPAAAMAETGNMASRTVSNVRAFFANIEEGAKRAAGAVSKVAKGFGKIGSTVFALPKFFTGQFASGITTAVKKVGELFAGLKRIAMYRLMRTAIKLFTQGLSEGLKNVYAYSQLVGTSFASNMDLIATNALYAKNSLGAMAAPLLNAIAPAVDYVTDKFVELFNVVNMFIARLTGAETATIAKKAATTWGDATEDAAGRGRQAVEELKRTILGFDELNVLQDNKDNGGGSGSGSGGGADVSSMFEQVPIESSISEFADRLREAFEEGDWSRLGTLLGEKFNDIVNDVPWADIGSKIGTGISAAINVVYSGLTAADFVNLGSKFAELFNAALTNFDAETFGKLAVKKFSILADLIIGAITTVDWGLVASKASEYVIGIFKELATWIQSVDWAALTKALFDNLVAAVKGIKYAEIVSSIVEYFGSALGALASVGSAMLDIVFDGMVTALTGIVTWVTENIIVPIVNALTSDETSLLDAGKTIIGNVWEGLKSVVTNVYTWIVDNVWTPFKNGFLSAFGINEGGASSDLLTIGENIITGIFKGITDWFGGIVTWAKENIFDKFVDGVKSVFGIHSPASKKDIVDLGTNIIEGVFSGIVDFFGGIVTWITDNVKKPFVNAWNSVFGSDGLVSNVVSIGVSLARDGWETVSGWFSGLGASVTGAVTTIFAWLQKSSAWTTVQGWFGKLGASVIDAATDIMANLKQSSGWKTVQGWFDGLGDTVTGAIAYVKAALQKSTTWSSVQSWFDGLGDSVVGAITYVKTALQKSSTWTSVQGWFNGLGDAVIGAVTYVKAALQKSSTWSTVQTWFNGLGNGVIGAVTTIFAWLKQSSGWTTVQGWFDKLGADKTGAVGNVMIGLIQQGWKTLKDWVFGVNANGTVSEKKTDFIEVPIKMRTMEDVRGETDAINKLWTLLDKEAKGENVTAEIQTLLKHAKENEWNDFINLYKQEKPAVTLEIGVNGKKDLEKAAAAWKAFKDKKNSKKATLTATGKLLDKTFTTITKGIEQSEGTNTATLKAKGDDSNSTYAGIARVFNNYGNETTTATLEAVGKKRGNAFENIASAMRAASSGNWAQVVSIMANVSNALGGAYYGGSWHGIPQYASGGIPSHGSMFVAGEAGAEVVGHINGRTEVLNASQLASAIHAAVLSAMQQANGSQSPMLNVTVRTEDNEVLARAVAKGQRSLDARLNPTAAY